MNKDLNSAMIAELEKYAKELFGLIQDLWKKVGKHKRFFVDKNDCFFSISELCKMEFWLYDKERGRDSVTIEVGTFRCEIMLIEAFRVLERFYKSCEVRKNKQLKLGYLAI